MITEKPFLYWYKTNCYIDNNIISEENHKKRTGYHITNKTPLLEDFLKIDEVSLDSVKRFIDNYGFLNHEYCGQIGSVTKKNKEWILENTYSERLEYFINQILIFKSLRILHSVYLSDNPIDTLLEEGSSIQWSYSILNKFLQKICNYLNVEIVNRKIENVEIKEVRNFKDSEYNIVSSNTYNKDKLRTDAADILTSTINDNITNIHPVLSLSLELDEINSTWQANSLLEILYIKYYDNISNGKELRMCANRKCAKDKYFPAYIDKEKRFCSPECAVQGMQNNNYKAIRDPNDEKYFPAKIKFDKIYHRLYYLDSNYKIDTTAFKDWNKEARKKLNDIKKGNLSESEFIKWLDETGNEEKFDKKRRYKNGQKT